MPSIYDLKVSGDLASQLQQEQQNGYMMGTDVFNGIQLPNEGDSLYDFLSYLTFGGQSQRAYDIAQMHGIDGPSFTALMNQKNQETAKSAPWLTQQIGNVGNTVAENPALLFAAPLAIGALGGAFGGAAASSTGTAAAGTGGAALPAAGYSGLATLPPGIEIGATATGVSGLGGAASGALGSLLSGVGAIASGTAPTQAYTGNGTGVQPGPADMIVTHPPASLGGAQIGGIAAGAAAGAGALASAGGTSTVAPETSIPPDATDITVTGQQPPPVDTTGGIGAGGAAAIGAGGAAVGNTINQGNQGPPEGDNNTSGLPDWLGPVTNIIGSLLGGQAQANASNNAADAIKQTSADQLGFLRETRDQQLALQQPFLDASKAALPRLAQLAGLEPGVTPQSVMEADPGYQFRLDEGTRAVENSAAARGGLLSGGFATNLLKQAQGYASNEYQNVYNRVANIAGFGQVASNAASSAIGQYGNQGAQVIGNSGNASAYNNLQRGNIWANAINDIGSTDWSKFFGNGG